MKIKSQVSKEELEIIIPILKKIIKKNTKGTVIYSWTWVIFATPLFIWTLKTIISSLIKSGTIHFFGVLAIIVTIVALILDLILILSLFNYPVFLHTLPIKDATYEIELDKQYKKYMRHVVVTNKYIFIHSVYKMKAKYFILINDNTPEFDHLKQKLLPRNKSKISYKYFEEK